MYFECPHMCAKFQNNRIKNTKIKWLKLLCWCCTIDKTFLQIQRSVSHAFSTTELHFLANFWLIFFFLVKILLMCLNVPKNLTVGKLGSQNPITMKKKLMSPCSLFIISGWTRLPTYLRPTDIDFSWNFTPCGIFYKSIYASYIWKITR